MEYSATSPLSSPYARNAKSIAIGVTIVRLLIILGYAITTWYTSKMLWEATPDEAKEKYTVHEVLPKWTRVVMLIVTILMGIAIIGSVVTTYLGYPAMKRWIKQNM